MRTNKENLIGLKQDLNIILNLIKQSNIGNFIVSGDNSVGKTSFAKQIADKLKYKLIEINCFNFYSIQEMNEIFSNIKEKTEKNKKLIVLLDNLEKLNEFEHSLIFNLKMRMNELNDKVLFIGELVNEELFTTIEEDLNELFTYSIYLNYELKNKILIWEYYIKSILNIELSKSIIKNVINSIPNFNIYNIQKTLKNINKEKLLKTKNKANFLLLNYLNNTNILVLNNKTTKEELYKVAVHEIGHVFGAYLNNLTIYNTIIESHSASNGLCTASLNNNFIVDNREDAIKMISYSLGGIVAEEIYYKTIFSGSYADLEDVDKYFDFMLEHGFTNSFGTMRMNKEDLSEAMKDYFFKEKQKIIENEKNKIKTYIKSNQSFFNKLVEKLIKKKILTYNELKI